MPSACVTTNALFNFSIVTAPSFISPLDTLVVAIYFLLVILLLLSF